MNNKKKTSFAAVLLTAALGGASVAEARVERVFVGGNITTCSDLFTALNKLDPAYQFGAYAPDGPVPIRSEIRITSIFEGVEAGDGVQSVRITNYDGASFDWNELDVVTGLEVGDLLGIDAVARKAGNGRTVDIYIPEGTSGENLRDHNNNSNITEALFCADSLGQAIPTGQFCSLDSSELADVCNLVGNNSLIEITTPSSATETTTSLCACPDVTSVECDPRPLGTEAGQCDPENPANDCCLAGPNGDPLTLGGLPTGRTDSIGLGSLCLVSTSTNLASGESTSTQTCFCDPFLEYASGGRCFCRPETRHPNELAPAYPVNCNSIY